LLKFVQYYLGGPPGYIAGYAWALVHVCSCFLKSLILLARARAPIDALRAMTGDAAELLGIQTGTIEINKLADIILIDGNPLENMGILQETNRIKMVMKDGRIEVRR